MTIANAAITDLPTLINIINSAYRGEASKTGWTTEAHFIAGDKRTDAGNLQEMLAKPGACMLKATDATGVIEGCVYLRADPDTLYLGMLSVKPMLQNKGIGKLLMAAAEQHALALHLPSITMYVVTIRQELIAWYQKLGYGDTLQRIPFPDLPEYGKPMQALEFMVMKKSLPDDEDYT